MKTMTRRVSEKTAAFAAALLLVILMSAAFALPVYAETPEEQADRILAGMTTRQKIAQMMVVTMPESGAAGIQKEYQFGG